MVGGHRAAVVFLPMLSPTSPPVPPPEAEAKNALVATASLSITAIAFSSVDSAFSSADSASTPPRMYHTCEWGSVASCRGRGRSADRGPAAVPVPAHHRAPRARAPGTLAPVPSRSRANGAAATERRAPAHRGRLPARRPAAVRTEPPPPSAARPRTGDACPRAVPQPCERSRRTHTGWDGRARRCGPGATPADAGARGHARIQEDGRSGWGILARMGCAAGGSSRMEGAAATRQRRGCGMRGSGSARMEGAVGGSSRGWKERGGCGMRGWGC
jgi:hypothetical protein